MNTEKNKIDIANFFKDGVINNNPILVQVLGACPTLATTTSVVNGVGMGLSTGAVLIFSNILISLMRKFIPKQVRIASYIVIISGFVAALEMLLKAYIPALDKSLGLFIPLITVNCLILARAEVFASKNNPVNAALDGFFTGLGFTAALFFLSAIREILGAGTFAGIKITPEIYSPAFLFVLPAGAFISLGCLIAAFRKINSYFVEKMEKEK